MILKTTCIKQISADGKTYTYEVIKTLFGIRIYWYIFQSNCNDDIKDRIFGNNKKYIGFNR